MGAVAKSTDAVLASLRGVWFPTHSSVDGRLVGTFEPAFPAPPQPWLLTITDAAWHVTSNADYYATGGCLRVEAEPGRLTFEYPPLSPEFDQRYLYRLSADELLLQSGGFVWSGPHDGISATRFVRVAVEATTGMKVLFASVERNMPRYPGRAEPAAAPDRRI